MTTAELSPNGKKLTVLMRGGGEGTAGYYVTWTLRANGQHSRAFESPGDV